MRSGNRKKLALWSYFGLLAIGYATGLMAVVLIIFGAFDVLFRAIRVILGALLVIFGLHSAYFRQDLANFWREVLERRPELRPFLFWGRNPVPAYFLLFGVLLVLAAGLFLVDALANL